MNETAGYLSILNKVFACAKQKAACVSPHRGKLTQQVSKHINVLVDNAESQKSLIAVLMTSLLEKIKNPVQDIRLHRKEFAGGYSGRSLDTKVVTPWLKSHFPRFAPKESGWLTRSIEQPHPFTKDFPGKIRNREVKNAFLSVLNEVAEGKQPPKACLEFLLIQLLNRCGKENEVLTKIDGIILSGILTIDIVIEMLEKHFALKQSSRSPVIAIYTIYELLLENVKIYQDKKLRPLRSHTTSDRYAGYADIEVVDSSSGQPFEVVEVKHNIPIDCLMIKDVFRKIENTAIKRYFVLTTATPNFKDTKKKIFKLVHEIKASYDIDVIPNGIIPSLKYYLRLIPELKEFLIRYTSNIKSEFEIGSDVKEFHISEWSLITANIK